MVDDKTLDLIQKLHNLAINKGATEAEAANALARMQALLFRHNLSIDDVNLSPEDRTSTLRDIPSDINEVTHHRFSHFSSRKNERQWVSDLAGVIARYNFGRIMIAEDYSRVWFVGTPENIQAIQAIWAYAVEQVLRLADEGWDADRIGRLTGLAPKIDPRQYKRNFSNGATRRIAQRLKAEWDKLQQESATSTALVVVNTAALEAYVEREKDPEAKTQKRTYGENHYGMSHGFQAGDRVNLGPRPKELA